MIGALLVHYIVGVLFLSFFRLCWSVLLFLSSVELLGIGPIPTILLSLLCLFWICIWIYWERLGLVFGTYGGFCFLSRVYSELSVQSVPLCNTYSNVGDANAHPTIR